MMTMILLALLTSPSKIDASCFIDRGIGKAPENVAPKTDLPRSVKQDDGSVLLPPPLAREIVTRLRCLWLWPDAAQLVLDTQAGIFAKRLEDEREVTEVAVDLSSEPTRVEGWPTWAVVLIGSASVVIGIAAGYGICKVIK